MMLNDETNQLTIDVMNCTKCGEPHQTPPLPFIHNDGSKVLVIAQNPAELPLNSLEYEFIEHLEERTTEEYLEWYRYWFIRSNAYTALGRLYFGDDWLRPRSNFSYTNIVRCRTKENARPPQEWANTCMLHTAKLLKHFNGVVLVGGLARDTFNSSMQWNKEYHTKRGGTIVCVKHYAAQQTRAEIRAAKMALTGAGML